MAKKKSASKPSARQKTRPAKPIRNRYTPKPAKKAKKATRKDTSAKELMAEIKRLRKELKAKDITIRKYEPEPDYVPKRTMPGGKGIGRETKAERTARKKPKRFKGKKALQRERKRVYGKRDRLRDKYKKAKTKKEKNRINKEIIQESVKLRKINEALGSRLKPLSKIKKRVVIATEDKIETRTVTIWNAKDQLNQSLSDGYFKTYTINGKKIRAGFANDVLAEFDALYDLSAMQGRNTPHVVMIRNYKTKNMSIGLYY